METKSKILIAFLFLGFTIFMCNPDIFGKAGAIQNYSYYHSSIFAPYSGLSTTELWTKFRLQPRFTWDGRKQDCEMSVYNEQFWKYNGFFSLHCWHYWSGE
jgi:hypothetical protein